MTARETELTEALADVVFQFAYRSPAGTSLGLTAGGLSALEGAFAALGWEDPHPVPEMECERPRCHEEATCGCPTPEGYQRLCYRHYEEWRPR